MASLRILSRRNTTQCTAIIQRNLIRYETRQQQKYLSSKNNFFSTTTTNDPAVVTRIISRRAYEHHLPSHPRLNPSSTTTTTTTSSSSSSTPTAEKPWPTSMKIGAAIATALVIPYTIGTLIASSQTLRDALQGNRPDVEEDRAWGKALVEFVRDYWGEEEVRPYVDNLPLLNPREGGKKKLYILEGEDTSVQRNQEKEICAMNHSNTKVRITIQGSGKSGIGGGICAERVLEGITPVNVQTMTNAVISTTNNNSEDVNIETSVDDDDGMASKVSVDFANFDIIDNEMKNNEVTTMVMMTEEDELSTTQTTMKEGQKIRQMTPIYSTWNHFPSTSSSNSSSSSSSSSTKSSSSSSTSTTTTTTTTTLSNKDIRIAELEWNIKELNAQLSDPNCTRDIDDMTIELKNAKKELRKLKGGWLSGLWK